MQAVVLVQANALRKLFPKVLPIQSTLIYASIAVHAQMFAPVKQFTRNNRSKTKDENGSSHRAVFCFKSQSAVPLIFATNLHVCMLKNMNLRIIGEIYVTLHFY